MEVKRPVAAVEDLVLLDSWMMLFDYDDMNPAGMKVVSERKHKTEILSGGTSSKENQRLDGIRGRGHGTRTRLSWGKC